MDHSEQAEQIVEAVRASPKYRQIAPDLVLNLARQELARRSSPKEAVKAVKNKLHQVAGAYLDRRPAYPTWLARLREAAPGGPEALKPVCAEIMASHASTRERLPDLEAFYQGLFASLPPVNRVLDAACGFNPLALPWMPLPSGAYYTAVDIYTDLADFLGAFFGLLPVQGQARARDVLEFQPEQRYDLALALKAIPCLEQADKGAGEKLLDRLPARWLIVSFPLRSLGGREKGMAVNYGAMFEALVSHKGWPAERLDLPGELVYQVEKPGGSAQ